MKLINILLLLLIGSLAYCNDYKELTWKVLDSNESFKGSCFLIHEDGYFLTAAHLVKGKSTFKIKNKIDGDLYEFNVKLLKTLCNDWTGKRCIEGNDVALLKIITETQKWNDLMEFHAISILDIEVEEKRPNEELNVYGYYNPGDAYTTEGNYTVLDLKTDLKRPEHLNRHVKLKHKFLVTFDKSTVNKGMSGGPAICNQKILGIQSFCDIDNDINYIEPIFNSKVKSLLGELPPLKRVSLQLEKVKNGKKINDIGFSNFEINQFCSIVINAKGTFDLKTRCNLSGYFLNGFMMKQLPHVLNTINIRDFLYEIIPCSSKQYDQFFANILQKESDKIGGSIDLLSKAIIAYESYFEDVERMEIKPASYRGTLYSYADANKKLAQLEVDDSLREYLLQNYAQVSAKVFKLSKDKDVALRANMLTRVGNYYYTTGEYESSKYMYFASAKEYYSQYLDNSIDAKFIEKRWKDYVVAESQDSDHNPIIWTDIDNIKSTEMNETNILSKLSNLNPTSAISISELLVRK